MALIIPGYEKISDETYVDYNSSLKGWNGVHRVLLLGIGKDPTPNKVWNFMLDKYYTISKTVGVSSPTVAGEGALERCLRNLPEEGAVVFTDHEEFALQLSNLPKVRPKKVIQIQSGFLTLEDINRCGRN